MSDSQPQTMGPPSEELQRALDVYRRHLPAAGSLYGFDISGLDHLQWPVWLTSFIGAEAGTADGFGYGAGAAEAQVGALGELNEMIHTDTALRRCPVRDGFSYRQLCRLEGPEAVIDPLTLCLPAASPYHPDLPLRWVPVQRWPAGSRHWVPREFAAARGSMLHTQSDHPDNRLEAAPSEALITPITCGLGAGISLEQALSHGVLELLQRDGNCTAFRAMDRGWVLDLDDVQDPGIGQLQAWLRERGVEVTVKLASTEFDLVNLYVVGRSVGEAADKVWFPLQQTACGEAVHANRERALRKALLEYMAARCRKAFMHGPLARIRALEQEGYLSHYLEHYALDQQEPRALEAMAHWLTLSASQLQDLLAPTVFSHSRTIPFSTLPTLADDAVRHPADRLADLVNRLEAAGLAVYYFDASITGGPRVVKAIVPGLEGETLSYYRMGERGVRRLVERAVDFVGLGDPPAGALPVRLTPQAEGRFGGPAWGHPQPAPPRG
ncbi:MAG: YcaO-like family protein, partial [Candidatus Competibacterales bacterium]